MSLADAALTFVSVFVAALLAFYLDGVRERLATRRWVREYLTFWRDVLESTKDGRASIEAGHQRIQQALGRWLSPDADPDWRHVDTVNVNTAVSFTPLLLSTGASAVPRELLHQLFLADATAPVVSRRSESVARIFETHVLPLVLARVRTLSPEQRRSVELFRDEFQGLRDHMSTYLDQLDGIRAELARLGF